MVKNKKGKKKNKMAGRNRSSTEAAPETGDRNVLVVPGDTSETDDRTDLGGPITPEPEALTSDSGIDSGRGSPGEVTGSSTTTGDTKIEIEAQIPEEKDFVDAEEDLVFEENSNNAEPMNPEAEARAPPPEKAEDKTPENSNEAEQIQSNEVLRSKAEDDADRNVKKPNASSGSKLDKQDAHSPTATVRSKGAVSMRRHKPIEDIKHPLEFPWVFWSMDPHVPWEEALDPVASFDTAEDFWWYFNTLRNPKALGKAILMFKKYVKPEWEDPRNSQGGRWNLMQGMQGRVAEEIWQELTLMMIGGIKFGSLTPHLNGIYCTWKLDGMHFSVWIDTIEERIARPIGNIIHETLFSVLNRSFNMELVLCNSNNRKKKVLAGIK